MRYSQRKINLLHLLTLVQFTEAFLPHASPRLLRPPCAVKHVLARLPVEDVSGGGDGGDGGGDGIQQWLQTNVLQGVALTPTTYSIMVVYFVQGALGLAALARTYFLKDQLGLAPAEQAALMGVSTLPWVIKPVYGFLTDGLPIFGLRRKPYLVIGGLLGASAWAALATVVETPLQAVVAATTASLGVAMSDVVVDSLVVEQARDDESASSGSLQSLCWTCQASGGLASAYLSGSLLETMRPQQVFGITALLPLLVALIAVQLDEKRVTRLEGGEAGGAVQEFVQRTRAQGGLLWDTVKQKQVWLPALFIFLWQATPSCGDAFFYFITEDLGIGPEFLGRIKVGTSLASIFGIWCYRTFLQQVPIKVILKWTAVASVAAGLSQLLLVTHLNRDLGIPDTLFTFGDDLVLTVFGQLAFMPLLVLAASLCPPGVEGTLFALLMSTFNAGGIVGQELGAALTQALGVSTSAEGGGTDFSHLFDLVLVCNLASLLPLFALRFIDEAEPPPEEGGGAMPSAMPSASEAASGPETGAPAALEPVANSQAL